MNLAILSEEADVVRVQVSGRIDQKEISPMTDPLGDVLGADAYSRIVLLDMSAVEMLDSSGVGWMLACNKKFREAGGRLVLHSLSLLARNVFKVLNMHLVLTMVADESDALRVIRGEPTT